MKRTAWVLEEIEIEIDWCKEEIAIYDHNKMPWGDLMEVPKDAILFKGTPKEFMEKLRNATTDRE